MVESLHATTWFTAEDVSSYKPAAELVKKCWLRRCKQLYLQGRARHLFLDCALIIAALIC